MTVTASTTTTYATGIKDVVDPNVIPSVFQNSHFTRILKNNFPEGESVVDDTVKVNAVVGSNANTATHAEATNAYPDADSTEYQQGAFTPVTIYSAYLVTDDLKRALGPGLRNSVTPGAFGDKIDSLRQTRDLLETTLMADAATGLLGQVDDDTTAWGGVNRGTYTSLKSYVVAGGSAALTAAMLHDAHRNVRNAPFGGNPELIVSGVYQKGYYVEKLVADAQGQPGGPGDLTYQNDRIFFAGIPWLDIPDFTASEIAFLHGIRDGSGICMVDHNFWNTADWGDAEVQFERLRLGPQNWLNLSHAKLGRTTPSSTYVWGVCVSLLTLLPMYQAKIEALATS